MDGSYKLTNGIFGHFNFESIQYFDSLSFDPDKRQVDIPDAKFILYRYIPVSYTHLDVYKRQELGYLCGVQKRHLQ